MSASLDRRRFLAAALAVAAAPAARGGGHRTPAVLACLGEPAGHAVAALQGDGSRLFTLALPGRGHAVVPRPGARQAVALARKPGTFGAVLDPARGTLLATFETSASP